jgi:hypothetical protein
MAHHRMPGRRAQDRLGCGPAQLRDPADRPARADPTSRDLADNQIRRRRDKEGRRRNVAGIAAERRQLMAAAGSEAPADATTSEGLAQLQGRALKQQLATADALRTIAGLLREHLLAILWPG